MRRCLEGFAVVALLLAANLSAIVSPTPVVGSIAACDTLGHYFAGDSSLATQEPIPYEGVSASLTYRNSGLCTTDKTSDNDSTAWTMLSSSDGDGYAQSGVLHNWPTGPCIRHWAAQNEYGIAGQESDVIGVCASAGEVHQAWQLWDPSIGRIVSLIDATRFITSSWNPFTVWTTPFLAQVVGETHYGNSDVPGLSASPSDFTTIQVQAYSNSWVPACGNVNWYAVPTAWRYTQSKPACNWLRVWTL